MKLRDLVNEGMDFWIPDAEKNKIKEKCPECDGTGEIPYTDDGCWQCRGDDTVEVPDVDYQPIHLSNRNATLVMNALGYPPNDDYYYEIKYVDIPEVKRTIMKYLNTDDSLSPYEVETTDRQVDRGWKKTTGDDGVTHIAKDKGARMVDFGVNADYFKRIFNALMPMLDHAQKNKMDISIS